MAAKIKHIEEAYETLIDKRDKTIESLTQQLEEVRQDIWNAACTIQETPDLPENLDKLKTDLFWLSNEILVRMKS